MKYLLVSIISAFSGALCLYLILQVPAFRRHVPASIVTPIGAEPTYKDLSSYEIEALRYRAAAGSQIVLDTAVATTSAFTQYHFHFLSDGNKVTGMLNMPHGSGPFPVVVQFRGYVDRDRFTTGEGTRRSGEVFASNGYLTIAPDFLGYGGSDMPSREIFEERFQTYTVALDLLSSLESLPLADLSRIGIWGHSNGGHIALTVLAVLQKPIPTVLWAPVTKAFPYSILYFTDEASDGGYFLRSELAKLEAHHDVRKFTVSEYLHDITASIQLHQGTLDDAVPVSWSDGFDRQMEQLDKDIRYYRYTGADHNMLGSWETVVQRDIQFYNSQLQ